MHKLAVWLAGLVVTRTRTAVSSIGPAPAE